jgi:hypothetical protein
MINLCGLVIVGHPATIDDELVRDLVFPWNEDSFETIGLAGEAKRHSHDGTSTNLNGFFYSTEVLLPSTSLDIFQAVGRCRIICEHLRYCHEVRPRCSSVQGANGESLLETFEKVQPLIIPRPLNLNPL